MHCGRITITLLNLIANVQTSTRDFETLTATGQITIERIATERIATERIATERIDRVKSFGRQQERQDNNALTKELGAGRLFQVRPIA